MYKKGRYNKCYVMMEACVLDPYSVKACHHYVVVLILHMLFCKLGRMPILCVQIRVIVREQ